MCLLLSSLRFLFQEIFIFDESGTNVGLLKPVTGSPQYVEPPNVYRNDAGNDGIVDADVVPLNLLHANAINGFWQVDLQGAFKRDTHVYPRRPTCNTCM